MSAPGAGGRAGSSGRRAALLLSVLLGGYVLAAGSRGIDFIRAGGLVPIALGLSVLLFPLIGAWILRREWTFGTRTQALGRELAARELLPADDLPRRPSGRPDRAAADARFAQVRDRVSAQPDAWEGWYLLAIAYDDAGDRRRARSAMRRAIALHGRAPRSGSTGGPGPG